MHIALTSDSDCRSPSPVPETYFLLLLHFFILHLLRFRSSSVTVVEAFQALRCFGCSRAIAVFGGPNLTPAMESRTCTNVSCGASSLAQWKNGWSLRSGEYATLCDKCGSAYEQSIFCDLFHATDSGWRECTLCGKRLHCGCAASRSLLELLDSGGVTCMNCARKSRHHDVAEKEMCDELETSKLHGTCKLQSISKDKQLDDSDDKIKFIQMDHHTVGNERRLLLQSQNHDVNRPFQQIKQEVIFPSMGENGRVMSLHLEFNQDFNGCCDATTPGLCKVGCGTKHLDEPLMQTSTNANLGSENSCPLIGVSICEREHKSSSPLQGSRSFPLVPKPPRSLLAAGLDANNAMISQIRVARPPAESKGRNQLLPRYWPRITDQELQQLSGSSNSTVVPLFEKMLSASDAGRIGRLVVPKACAEAYFPPISQPEGLPIRIQDVKGREWVFQFRFWPNNNSRMYVLEGVTPCIQSMQLQAGDTVTFSRMDPEGKLIMGFRKASASVATQDSHLSTIPSCAQSSETFFSGAFDNLSIVSGHSSLLQYLKESGGSQLNALPKHLIPVSADMSYYRTETHDDRTKDPLLLPSGVVPERKKARNIGSKSKRLLIDNQDSLELKLTWEEAQDLLCPPPSVKPSKVVIEDHEFEEYEDPPIFGKRSIFIARSIGEQEQWVQCDDCSKWRRLPIDVLLPSKWTCEDNVWDQNRKSCSASDELTPREMENFCKLVKDFKRRRFMLSQRSPQDDESSGLDALANAAILGDNDGDPGTASIATTTKHPRHRPGCSCIVCIQPPSGKGKHKPSCTCNVCMTVKRRFKTLMMRKKKRQSEREAEIAQRNQHKWGLREELELETTSRHASSSIDPSENATRSTHQELESKNQNKVGETEKSQLDLNCHPEEDELLGGSKRVSMTSLLQVASLPLEMYLKQNGLTSLISEAPTSPTSNALPPTHGANEIEAEQESGGEEYCEPDQGRNNLL